MGNRWLFECKRKDVSILFGKGEAKSMELEQVLPRPPPVSISHRIGSCSGFSREDETAVLFLEALNNRTSPSSYVGLERQAKK